MLKRTIVSRRLLSTNSAFDPLWTLAALLMALLAVGLAGGVAVLIAFALVWIASFWGIQMPFWVALALTLIIGMFAKR